MEINLWEASCRAEQALRLQYERAHDEKLSTDQKSIEFSSFYQSL